MKKIIGLILVLLCLTGCSDVVLDVGEPYPYSTTVVYTGRPIYYHRYRPLPPPPPRPHHIVPLPPRRPSMHGNPGGGGGHRPNPNPNNGGRH